MALKARQRAFADEYLVDLNATLAARRAGYGAKYARQQGTVLMKNPEVKALITAGLKERATRNALTGDEVIGNIRRLGSEAELMGNIPAALKAQELLGKYLKLFTEQVELHGKITIADLVAAASKPKGG